MSLKDKIRKAVPLDAVKKPHVIIKARAGTGKTFSLMGGLAWAFRKRCPALWKQFKWQKGYKAGSETEEECIADVEPSTQQLAIWQQMQDGIGSVRTVRYNAFSSSVVAAFKKEYHYFPKELASVGVKMDFMTIHGFGFRAVIKSHGKGVKPNKYLDYGLALGLFEDAQVTDDLKPSLAFTVYNIADSVKQWLIPTDIED